MSRTVSSHVKSIEFTNVKSLFSFLFFFFFFFFFSNEISWKMTKTWNGVWFPTRSWYSKHLITTVLQKRRVKPVSALGCVHRELSLNLYVQITSSGWTQWRKLTAKSKKPGTQQQAQHGDSVPWRAPPRYIPEECPAHLGAPQQQSVLYTR